MVKSEFPEINIFDEMHSLKEEQNHLTNSSIKGDRVLPINDQTSEIDIVDEMHFLKEEQKDLTNSSIKGSSNISSNEVHTVKVPIIKLSRLYWCNKCQKRFKTAEILKIHTEEQKHLTNSPIKGNRVLPINHQTSEIDIVDEMHFLKEEQIDLTNSSIKGNSDIPSNEVGTLKTPIIKLSRLYWCNKCKKKFETAESLKMHTKAHDLMKKSVTVPTCPTCKKVYTRVTNLNAHIMRRHKSFVPFKCKYCKKIFLRKRSFREHMLMHEKGDYYPYFCDICSKGYMNKYSLSDHIKRHMSERPFKCKICGKGFIHPSHCKIHERSHSGEKPFECDICKRKFATRANMKRHILRAFECLNDYKCPSCIRGFSAIKALKRHIIDCFDKSNEYIIATTKRSGDPYFCDICSKFFLTKAYFDYHKNLHSVTETNACEICKKRFLNSFLRVYQSNLTKESPYFECDICKLKFCHRTTWFKHRKTHNCNSSPEINNVHEMVHQQIPFKSAPLKTCDKKNLGEMMQRKEIVSIAETGPASEIQDKEEIILLQKEIRLGELKSGFKTRNSNSNSDAHKNLHSNQSIYMCEICLKVFLKKTSLKSHQRSLTEGNPYFECDYCKLKFCHKYTLEMHQKNNHPIHKIPQNNYRILKMPLQQITFKNAPLKTYERKKVPGATQPTHFQRGVLKTYERSEIQDEVSNLFQEQMRLGESESGSDASTSNLNSDAHKNLHLIQDKEESNLVSEQSRLRKLENDSNERNSDAYQNPHLTQNHYICKICKKIFLNRKSLYSHQRTLTDENPYFECGDCNRKFCHKITLAAHLRFSHPNLKMPLQKITLKNAPLKIDVRKKMPSSIKDGKGYEPINLQRGISKTFERNKNLGEKMQINEIVVTTEPISEIQDNEDSNLVEEQRLGKLTERKNSGLCVVEEPPRDPLDLTESENSVLFSSMKEETVDPLDLSDEIETCDVKVELEK